MTTLAIGLKGEHSTSVTEALTAQAMGSGSLPVLATPALVALMEAAAVAALEGHLESGQTSVGVALDVRHVAATPVGHRVSAEAEITEIDGRTLTFKVRAWDERELIGEGLHRRVIIDSARFLQRANEK